MGRHRRLQNLPERRSELFSHLNVFRYDRGSKRTVGDCGVNAGDLDKDRVRAHLFQYSSRRWLRDPDFGSVQFLVSDDLVGTMALHFLSH